MSGGKTISNYDKYMKHWKNHGKDRNYQQCGFHMEGKEKSGATIAEDIKQNKIYVAVKQTSEKLSQDYDNEDEAVEFYRSLPKEK